MAKSIDRRTMTLKAKFTPEEHNALRVYLLRRHITVQAWMEEQVRKALRRAQQVEEQ